MYFRSQNSWQRHLGQRASFALLTPATPPTKVDKPANPPPIREMMTPTTAKKMPQTALKPSTSPLGFASGGGVGLPVSGSFWNGSSSCGESPQLSGGCMGSTRLQPTTSPLVMNQRTSQVSTHAPLSPSGVIPPPGGGGPYTAVKHSTQYLPKPGGSTSVGKGLRTLIQVMRSSGSSGCLPGSMSWSWRLASHRSGQLA